MSDSEIPKSNAGTAGGILLAFAVICFITSLIVGATTSGQTVKRDLPETGGEVGPIPVDKANTVYEVKVVHNTSDQSYRFIEGTLLDRNKEYLFGFGDEMWQESGYDDGYWSERDNDFTVKVTIPEPGAYYFKFNSEGSSNSGREIKVKISRLNGSSLPHLWMGIFGLIAAIVMWFIRANQAAKDPDFDPSPDY